MEGARWITLQTQDVDGLLADRATLLKEVAWQKDCYEDRQRHLDYAHRQEDALEAEIKRLQGSALVWHDATQEQPTDIYEKFVYYGAASRFDVTFYNPRLGKWHALAGHVVTHWAEPIAPSEPPEKEE